MDSTYRSEDAARGRGGANTEPRGDKSVGFPIPRFTTLFPLFPP